MSSAEISYVNGVTSSIQTQLNNKPNIFTSSTDPSLVYTVKNGDRWIYDGTPLTGYEWINNNWFVSSGGYGSHMIPNIGEYYICGIVFYIVKELLNDNCMLDDEIILFIEEVPSVKIIIPCSYIILPTLMNEKSLYKDTPYNPRPYTSL